MSELLIQDGSPSLANIVCPSAMCENEPVSTAVIRIYTPEGFVIAADGLRKKCESKTTIEETAQKIFLTSSQWGVLAFAFAGLTEYEYGDVKADWKQQAQKIAIKLQEKNPKDINDYAQQFCGQIRRWIKEENPRLKYSEIKSKETKLTLAGYFHGQPVMDQHRISYDDEIKISLCHSGTVGKNETRMNGSEIIWQILRNGLDSRFDNYRIPAFQKREREPLSLSEAIDVANNYILACSDPLAREIDKNCCEIGGRIHIATITPQQVRWVVPPIGGKYL